MKKDMSMNALIPPLRACGLMLLLAAGLNAWSCEDGHAHMSPGNDMSEHMMDHAGHMDAASGMTEGEVRKIDGAQAKLTLVIYMGIRGAEQLQADLLKGLPTDTPVAVIHNVSLPDQRHAFCTLETLHETVVREALTSPSVIVVGDVLEGLASVQSHSFTQVLRDAQG